MDLTRPVVYRDLQLNDAATVGGLIVGCQIDAADYSAVPAVGYSEKRSQGDGNDASDVFLGPRRVVLQGTVYGASRADLYDRLQQLRYAFSPTAAYAESPGEYGYLPLDFEVPTLDSRWSTGFIPQELRVRPMRALEFTIRRDSVGGEDTRGMAMPWSATLEAKDPRVYAQDQTDYAGWVGRTNGAGTWVNRGDYPAPLNILLYQPAGAAQSTLSLAIGGSNMQIITPANASKAQTLRYDGTKKVLTLQIDQTVSLRMDLLRFTSGLTHPLVPSGTVDFTYARGVAIPVNSHMWFWESWA